MNLHRTTGTPDWHAIDPSKRNFWQRCAVVTHGVVTPGNLVTIVGLILVLWGLIVLIVGDYWLAGGLVLVGRLCDLLDGWAADATQTKSPLGELMDATADKIETAAALVAIWVAGVAPWWLVLGLIATQLLISGIAVIARRRGVELHPSRRGKLAMAFIWVLLVGLVVLKATQVAASVTFLTSLVAGGAVIILVLFVAGEYAQQLRRVK